MEQSGKASYETLRALASTLEQDMDDLVVKVDGVAAQPSATKRQNPIAALTMLLAIISSVFMTSATTASSGIEIISHSLQKSKGPENLAH